MAEALLVAWLDALLAEALLLEALALFLGLALELLVVVCLSLLVGLSMRLASLPADNLVALARVVEVSSDLACIVAPLCVVPLCLVQVLIKSYMLLVVF